MEQNLNINNDSSDEDWNPEDCRPKTYGPEEGFYFEEVFHPFSQYSPDIWSQSLKEGKAIYPYVLSNGLLLLFQYGAVLGFDYPDYPEGYYPFEQNPVKNPPRVRKPPYTQSNAFCPGALETKEVAAQSLENLCGNLNEGYLPQNPMGSYINGQPYPFELIRNRTLDFFSKTLPILRVDQTLPKVAKYLNTKENIWYKRRNQNRPNSLKRSSLNNQNKVLKRIKRNATFGINTDKNITSSVEESSFRRSRQRFLTSDSLSEAAKQKVLQEHLALRKATDEGRSAKSFCENNWGILCIIYNQFTGNKKSREPLVERNERFPLDGSAEQNTLDEGGLRPLTPCPSAVEYVTPVYARNYQGVWRYVVQIPYEGYFTQTVEITQCLSSKCHYLSGSCLSSPRWISLLVAEMFYPEAIFPQAHRLPDLERPAISSRERPPPPSKRGQFVNRQGEAQRNSGNPPHQHCDGFDEIGCFQVRLYYDWFLVPGACKCWKQDFYAKFAVKN